MKNVLIFDDLELEIQKAFLEDGWNVYVYLSFDLLQQSRYDRFSKALLKANIINEKDALFQEFSDTGVQIAECPYAMGSDSFDAWLKREIDLVVAPFPADCDVFSYIKKLGVPCIGQSDKVVRIEEDRMAANNLFQSIGGDLLPAWRSPAAKVMDLVQSMIDKGEYGKDQSWVLRNVSGNPNNMFRTHICRDLVQLEFYLSFLEPEDDIILQEFTTDPLISITTMFDGEKFVRNPNHDSVLAITDIEQKGALNQDRGQVLAGQTGTVATAIEMEPELNEVFEALAPFLKGNLVGFFDIHFAIGKNNEIKLLEFTPRFGIPIVFAFMSMLKGISFPQFLWDLAHKSRDVGKHIDSDSVYLGGGVYSYGVGINTSREERAHSIATGFGRVDSNVDIKAVTNKFKMNEEGTGIDRENKTFQLGDTICLLTVSSASLPNQSGKTALDCCIEAMYDNLPRISGYGVTYRDDYGMVDQRLTQAKIFTEKSRQKLRHTQVGLKGNK